MQDGSGMCGFMDKTGRIITPCTWKRVKDFNEGMAVVTDSNGYKGYIDKTGKLVIPCKFNSAYSFDGGEAVVNFEDKDGSNKI